MVVLCVFSHLLYAVETTDIIYSIAGCITGQSHNSESCRSQGAINATCSFSLASHRHNIYCILYIRRRIFNPY